MRLVGNRVTFLCYAVSTKCHVHRYMKTNNIPFVYAIWYVRLDLRLLLLLNFILFYMQGGYSIMAEFF